MILIAIWPVLNNLLKVFVLIIVTNLINNSL